MSKHQYIAWARVSSAQQRDEGWSLDYQKEKLEDYARRAGGEVLKTYVVTETASKSQERKIFREMLAFARENAGDLAGLLVMKIDRAARNLWDYVELERLEQEYGVKLISITQPTEATPSGRMMRRTLANFAAFFTDQLSHDVKQSMKRRAEAGLFVTLAPYGYRNVKDAGGRRVVGVDPIEARTVKEIFRLYAYHGHTLDSLRDALHAGGWHYKPERPKWTRSKVHELLTDRSYIGEVDHLGQWYPGTQESLIDFATFQRVQVLLGRRTYRGHDMLYAGNLITCGECGRPITGELKTKQTKSGPRQHIYYRCSSYNAPGHPRVRLTEAELDRQVMDIFDRLRIEDDDMRGLFMDVFTAKNAAVQAAGKARREKLSAELARVRNQKDVLLNLRLAGEIDPATYAAKAKDLRDREALALAELEAAGLDQSEDAAIVLQAFELSQSLRPRWVAAELEAKRRILEVICLNLKLCDVSLVAEMRKPFDVFAEGPILAVSANDRTPIERPASRFAAHALTLPPQIRLILRAILDGRVAA